MDGFHGARGVREAREAGKSSAEIVSIIFAALRGALPLGEILPLSIGAEAIEESAEARHAYADVLIRRDGRIFDGGDLGDQVMGVFAGSFFVDLGESVGELGVGFVVPSLVTAVGTVRINGTDDAAGLIDERHCAGTSTAGSDFLISVGEASFD